MEKVIAILVMALSGMLSFDNSSSSHSNNRKNNFLVLAEGDTFGINGNFGAPEKSK